MKGLALIGLSLPFFIAGINGMIEIVKRYAFGS